MVIVKPSLLVTRVKTRRYTHTHLMKRKGDNSNQNNNRRVVSPWEDLPRVVKQVLVTQIGAAGSVGIGLLLLSRISKRMREFMDDEQRWKYAVETDFERVGQEGLQKIRDELKRKALPRANDYYNGLPSKHMWLAMRHAFGVFLYTGSAQTAVRNSSKYHLMEMPYKIEFDSMSSKMIRIYGVFNPPWLKPVPFEKKVKLRGIEATNALEKGMPIEDVLDIEWVDIVDIWDYTTTMERIDPLQVAISLTSKVDEPMRPLFVGAMTFEREMDIRTLPDLLNHVVEEEFYYDRRAVLTVATNPILRILTENSGPMRKWLDEEGFDHTLLDFDFYKEIPRSTDSGKLQIGCNVCGTGEQNQLFKCGGCHKVQYCSKSCQSVDWTEHQHLCYK